MAKQRTWSEAERREALDLADRVGAAEASRQTGIPDGTIRRLRHSRNQSGPPRGRDPHDWAAAKEATARQAFKTAKAALAKVTELTAAGKMGEAQRAALTFAILADKSGVLEVAAAAARTTVVDGEPSGASGDPAPAFATPSDADRLLEVASILRDIGVLSEDDQEGPPDRDRGPLLLPPGPPPHPDGADETEITAPVAAPRRVVQVNGRTVPTLEDFEDLPESSWRPFR